MSETATIALSQSIWRRCSLVLWALLLLVAVFTVGDYGLSWDENFRFRDADSKLNYYQELLAGDSPKAPSSSYPGLFDVPLAIVHELMPDLGTRSQKGHVWSLCFGLLGLFSVWRLTAWIGGERAGFWALLFLATLPRYYGHMFFNPKDIPLAGTYAFGVWALVALFSRLPKPQWKWVVWVGVAAGLSMSTRIAGFLILVYFGGFVGLHLLSECFLKRLSWSELPRRMLYWGLRGALAGAIGFTILYVSWPALHSNPFGAAGASVEQVQNFSWEGLVLMDGFFWKAQDLPIYYLPFWIVVTTPAHLLILIAGGWLLTLFTFIRVLRQGGEEATLFFPRWIIVCAGLFPLVYIIWKDPVLYDGMRHILFIMPLLVALAAVTFEDSLRWCEGKQFRLLVSILQFVGLCAVAIVVLHMWALHPYQYVYFNVISGGLPAAYNQNETDYWGLSHKEAGEWLNQYIVEIDPDRDRVYRVHQRYSRWMLQEALDPTRFEMWQPREGADFFVSVTRFNLHDSYPEAKLLHVVEREGVPLCFIYSFQSDPLSAEK
ncbi:glycosyltransferase family 39 protein [Coraliomargarita algicola]|uniref:Glycosyltransferase family 39 protein n=1 Tax=Coraliomargarita algicola TaxID=3092156 RepID=A0ABZ0RHZ6_9BACT|nr:glycosyltransferase family 39 protein [Coraliomargarita sp. J2-16]WPJ94693.1 glycosyltransferase family 39 protein [Coraliomargarita sp. J2-16]